MERAIDAEVAKKRLQAWIDESDAQGFDKEATCFRDCISLLDAVPTLTPPNEPLTLISMSDEIPPDNERVLVYRPCMVDSDTGPYSVQWGWAAKRDGSHWARLPDRRPPEGESDETE